MHQFGKGDMDFKNSGFGLFCWRHSGDYLESAGRIAHKEGKAAFPAARGYDLIRYVAYAATAIGWNVNSN
jgi:hypothetical protein